MTSGDRYCAQLKYSRSPSISAFGYLSGVGDDSAEAPEVPHAAASNKADPPRPNAAPPRRKSRRLISVVRIFGAIQLSSLLRAFGVPASIGKTIVPCLNCQIVLHFCRH